MPIIGVNLGRMQNRGALLAPRAHEIFKMYPPGKMKPVIGKTFPLAEAAVRAQIHSRRGKISARWF